MPGTADDPPVLVPPEAPPPPSLQLATPAARRPARRGKLIEDLHDPLTQRRAVVLTAVLGPCRGVAPHEWKLAPG